ncbi:hypothetical protein M1373_00460 [Candidatus Marsarchaeota archaeon]|nr:hypothetical protein [Candidatus Marsarchaeota archaeon]MCL5404577.1 hypothetical protein [Candidatus Marsarchaeota archaeon]
MAYAEAKGQKKKDAKAVFLIKPASKMGGLDYLHVALIALVIVLAALAFSLANFKTTIVCQYGMSSSGACITPKYNESQALAAASKVLAGYQYVNTSLSILAYYSLVNQSKASYMPATNSWLVVVPYKDPFSNSILNVSLQFYGSNLTLETPYIQMLRSRIVTNNSVVAPGVLQLSGKTSCASTPPIPVYMITDPYAPGAIGAIEEGINMSKEYAGKLNMSYKFVFSSYSISKYRAYGIQQTQLLGAYLACASAQPKFAQFVSTLGSVYDGNPLSNVTLYSMANATGFNMSAFGQCMASAPTTLSYQAELASFYNVTSTPIFIANCKYEAIPETARNAINYSLARLG